MRTALVMDLMAGPAIAQDWTAMTGDQIQTALEDRRLHYADATQVFYKGGRTLYDGGGPSWGNWAVRGDQYCSQWQPGNGWECYDIQASGGAVRFLDGNGNVTEGRYDK